MTELLKVQMTSKEVLPLFPTLVWKSQLSPETHGPLNRKILEKLEETDGIVRAGSPPLPNTAYRLIF
jgi:hypothetical protein